MHLAAGSRLLGLLAVADPVKTSTPEALAVLRQAGLRVIMATGDGETTARAVGQRLGIDEVYGEVKPADKLALVERLQKEGHVVAMAGDGINDAPALARADVGIAMGTAGSDIALETADVALMADDLTRLVTAITIGRRTRRVVTQNLILSLIILAALVPAALFGVIGLAAAVLAHELSELVVILTAPAWPRSRATWL